MTRPISQTFRSAMYAPETGEAVIPLVELRRDGWDGPVRLAANGEDVVHQGATFVAYPFAITLPDDEDEGKPIMRWVADNASLELIEELRVNARTIYVTVRWVLLSAPDFAEIELEGEMPGVEYDAERITGQITVEPVLDAPLSRLAFTPEKFPGLFG
jgi:hypothetical protein